MWDRIKEGLKTAFPVPRLPQKRYIALIMILYGLAKIYTSSTPTLIDDQILDYLHDAVVQFANADDVDYSDDVNQEEVNLNS